VIRTIGLVAVLLLSAGAAGDAQGVQAANESLWDAARAGDTARIIAALDQGADINARARYDVTALFFAAGSGRLEAVKLLIARGADVNAQDSFYRGTAADMPVSVAFGRTGGAPAIVASVAVLRTPVPAATGAGCCDALFGRAGESPRRTL
jgi:hypothetical protein